MGRHRAPDPDEPTDEPSDDYSEPHDFGDLGDDRESDNFPPAEPPGIGGVPGPAYPAPPSVDYASGFQSAALYFDNSYPPYRDKPLEEQPPPAAVDTPDPISGL